MDEMIAGCRAVAGALAEFFTCVGQGGFRDFDKIASAYEPLRPLERDELIDPVMDTVRMAGTADPTMQVIPEALIVVGDGLVGQLQASRPALPLRRSACWLALRFYQLAELSSPLTIGPGIDPSTARRLAGSVKILSAAQPSGTFNEQAMALWRARLGCNATTTWHLDDIPQRQTPDALVLARDVMRDLDTRLHGNASTKLFGPLTQAACSVLRIHPPEVTRPQVQSLLRLQ